MSGGSAIGSEDFSDTIFWFLHENSPLPEDFSGSVDHASLAADDDGDDEDSSVNSEEERISFWNEQQQLLQSALSRTTPTESRVRRATEEALTESAPQCRCRRAVAAPAACRSCARKEISERLSRAGFNCSIRNSKWKSSPHIPSGEHTYLEVEEEKGVKVIVELHLRAEFEMGRAGEDYNRLFSRLPEVFVGKPERLRKVVKILCGAARRTMKEKKLHMGPWRKLKYMQAKWLSSTSTPFEPPQEAVVPGGRARRPRASLLTFALVGNLPGPHCQAVAVV